MSRKIILLKPTHDCNLNCDYCYDRKNRIKLGDIKMSDETINNIIEKVIPCYKELEIIWHGGEALMMGTDWIIEKSNLFKKTAEKYNNDLSISIQSNGILLTKENFNKLKENNISPSSSYDINDNKNRGKNLEIKKNIDDNNINFISVINYESSFKLIESYEKLKEKNKLCSFNIIFDYDFEKDFNILKNYVENWKKYLTYYFYDSSENSFEEREALDYFKAILGKNNLVCHHKNCIGSYFCIDPLGNIEHCDRGFSDKYKFGNINNLKISILEIYSSDKFLNFKKENNDYIEDCKKNCEVFELCKGGCPNERFFKNINKMEKDYYQCFIRKELYKHCFELIKNISKEEMLKINKHIFKEIWSDDYYSLERIRNEY